MWGRAAAAGAAACALLVAACALVATAPTPPVVALASATSSVATKGLPPVRPALASADVAKASADALAKGLPPAPAGGRDGTGSVAWKKVVANVKEAAKERMKQLGAMLDQQRESDAAMANAEQEARQYNVLSFAHTIARAPAGRRRAPAGDSGAAQAAQDAEGELARYSTVAGSGSDAYEEDKQFLSMERQRSSEHNSHLHSAEVPALKAASDLLARYGKLASAGERAYNTDSISMQADALQASEQASDSAHSKAVVNRGPAHSSGGPVAVGTGIHVLSPTQHWRSAKVEGNEQGQVLVHYDGFEHKYDEWIPAGSNRIRGLPRVAGAKSSPQEAAKTKVASEFEHYAKVAEAGQDAYKADSRAAAAGNAWDVHKQYVQDEMRGEDEAVKTAARYSQIAALGTPMERAQAAPPPAAPPAPAAMARAEVDTKTVQPVREPHLDVVQAAAQAAANAAAGVVAEAKAAVDEVEGRPGAPAPSSKERPQEQLRAKSGGAKHGRGRLGSSTERTYAQVARLLALAATTAKAEGNVPVSKEVAQEEVTLASLRAVPGKLPERMQHNLVSAGASLLRRLGIGAGATHVRQSTPLTANDNNAVLAMDASSEGAAAAAKQRAMVHLHQLHARAHVAQQRLAAEGENAGTAADQEADSVEGQAHGEATAEQSASEDHEEEPANETPAEVQPPVAVQAPGAEEVGEEPRRRPGAEGEGEVEEECDAACERKRRREEWHRTHQYGGSGPKREPAQPHQREWQHRSHPLQERKIDEPAARAPLGETGAARRAEAGVCWVPDLPEVRKALCTPSMYKDGTCEEVWGDVPEITGPIEAFALQRVHVPGDASKLHLDVVTAPYTQMAKRKFGSITAGYQKRADGAAWQYEASPVASSSPWSAIGFFENAPDMLVKDCDGGFLGVISMDPLAGAAPAGQEAEASANTGGVFKPQSTSEQAVRAQILGETGKESLTLLKGGLDVLGDDVGVVRYHVYTTDTRRLVAVMERRRQGEGAMDWVIRLEKGGPLDVRVAGILAAQLEAESMHQVTDMKAVMLAVALIVLGLLLLCCLLPIVVRWYSARSRRAKAPAPPPVPADKVEAVELPHATSAASNAGGLSARSAPRSLASSYAPTGTTRGLSPRTDGGDTLSTGRDDYFRGDFWDRLPALDEPTPRGKGYYQAPVPRSSQTPSMAPLMQASSLRGLPSEAADNESTIRAMLAQHQGGAAAAGPKTTPRGWEAASFRDTQRAYRGEGDLEIRDVLHSVLDPLPGGDTANRPESFAGGRRPKSLREWAEKYDFTLPQDGGAP